MRKTILFLISLVLAFVVFEVCLFAGRRYRLRNCIILRYNDTEFIFEKASFPDSLEMESFIKMYGMLRKDGDVCSEETRQEVLHFLDERIAVCRARAIERANHCDEKLSMYVLEAVEEVEGKR